MEILWLAILFYSVGLAAVLHFRPALMFNESGAWKEFGYHRSSRYTIFPFWLFAIVWAIVSYTLAAAIVWAWKSPVSMTATTGFGVAAASQMVHFDNEDDEEEGYANTSAPQMIPVSSVSETEVAAPMTETIRMRPSNKRIQTPARQPRMGYYVLDPASETSGLRRYIYYGAAPPPDGIVDTSQ